MTDKKEEQKYFSYSTLVLMIIRDYRQSRHINQGHIARLLDVVPSTYNKIENGQIGLTMDVFFKIATQLNLTGLNASAIVHLADLYAMTLFHAGWRQVGNNPDEDTLRPLLQEFFGERIYQQAMRDPAEKNTYQWSTSRELPAALKYCISAEYREQLTNQVGKQQY